LSEINKMRIYRQILSVLTLTILTGALGPALAQPVAGGEAPPAPPGTAVAEGTPDPAVQAPARGPGKHRGDPDSRGTPWESLDAQQQALLEPFRESWSQLPPRRQDRLAWNARRWAAMTPEEQAAARERLQRLKELGPRQREFMGRQFRHYQEMSPEEQARVRENFQRFRKLSPEERQRMRERWQALPPEERQRILEERRRPSVTTP
jgi:hypothetical protein